MNKNNQQSDIIPVREVGDLLLAYLQQLEVKYVFGVPGGAIEPLYNALARSERAGGPRSIVARHEAGAAFMADGYARATGGIGVCCATTGPGATNLITGVASAYENRIPMLVITAQTTMSNFGRGAFQESSCTGIDIVGMFRLCTRYNTLVSHADQFERKLASAILHAKSSRPGPAHLSIPSNIMRDLSPTTSPSFELASRFGVRPFSQVDQSVDDAVEQIEAAGKAVFVIGHGCRDAIGTILELAVLTDSYVVVTPHGKGLVSPYHPLFRGVFGFAGHPSAREALIDPQVDIIVAIGVTLSEWASNGWDDHALLNSKLIHIDGDEENFTRTPMAGMHILGSVENIFTYMLEKMAPEESDRDTIWNNPLKPAKIIPTCPYQEPVRYFQMENEEAYVDDSTPIKPQRLMHDLSRKLPSHARFLVDTGNSTSWSIHYLHPFDRRVSGKRDARSSTLDGCMEFASMGWAVGAAVGAALAARDKPTVCITGDGSLLMGGQEITVAIQEKLPVIFVILNDSALGMVKHGQCLGGAERVGYQLPEIDYCAFAKSLGAYAYTIYSSADLGELDFDAILKRSGPTLLDVHIDRDEVPPISAHVSHLQDVV